MATYLTKTCTPQRIEAERWDPAVQLNLALRNLTQ